MRDARWTVLGGLVTLFVGCLPSPPQPADASEDPADAVADALADAASPTPDHPTDATRDVAAEASARPDVAPDADAAVAPDVPTSPLAPGWARSLGASNRGDALAVAVDVAGDVYVAGHFERSMTLGSMTLTAEGASYGNFVASFTAAGALRWARGLGSTGWYPGMGLAATPRGGVVFAGHATGVADLGCGPTGTPTTPDSVAVVSFNADGTCRWSRRYPGAGRGHAYGVATDAAGNSYVAGHLGGATALGGATLRGIGERFGFVASYTDAGEHRWSQSYTGSAWSDCVTVAAQPTGEVLVLAGSYRAIDLGVTEVTAPGEFIVALALDRDGRHRWHITGTAAASGYLRGGAVAAAASGTWLLGGFANRSARFGDATLTEDPEVQGYHATLGADGAVAGVGVTAGALRAETTAVAADAFGRRFVGGMVRARAPVPLGALTLPGRGVDDGWWAAVDAAGAPRRARVLGGAETNEAVQALAVAPDGALYLAGHFSGASDLGETLRTTAERDGFLARVLPDAPPAVCRGAEVACADRCVDTARDDAHCGRCDHACPSTESCRAGACERPCAAGQITCTVAGVRACVTPASDVAHCGACGVACNPGASCVAGRCACPAGQRECAGRCVDPATSLEHCGACGTACAPPNAVGRCAAGACAVAGCLAGRADCNGALADGCEVNVLTNASHCGACGRACAAGQRCVAGACCVGAACAPFPSSGREGAFAPTADTVLSSGVHEFTTVTIPAGVTVRTDGAGVLELRATGPVTILGAVDLSGSGGGSARCPGMAPDRPFTCAGGAGGATGHPGEATGAGAGGGYSVSGADLEFLTNAGGSGGAGPAGGGGGQAERGCASSLIALRGQASAGGAAGGACTFVSTTTATCTTARGGPSSVAAYAGRDAATVTASSCGSSVQWPAGGGGGGSIGTAAATDLAVATTFQVGSGGGGGGRPLSALGGGGGGGGGGALRVASPVSITLGAAARLLADGGNGSSPGGGGGSGGVVALSAPSLVVPAGARVSARGGSASAPGGDGGTGRIRLSATPATCMLGGTFDPPLAAGCTPASAPVVGRVYVGAYPD